VRALKERLHVGVMGAGAVGIFVGGRLAAAGHRVTLVGRPRVLDPIAARGVVLEDLDGSARRVSSDAIRCVADASALADADVVLVTTKTAGTSDAAVAISKATAEHVPAISLQNGVDGGVTLRDVLGPRRGYSGMIASNVIFRDETTLRRTTTGEIVVQRMASEDEASTHRAVPRLVDALVGAGLDARGTTAIAPVLWSKLLFNLNNAINALSGLPLATEISDRGYRRVLARAMREGIAVMRAMDLRPVRLGRLHAGLASRVLPLPDWLFRGLAGAMVRIDPEARSSMADDLTQRRLTEIDALNGAIVRHGARLGVEAPVNARIVELVREAERAGVGSPSLRPEALLPLSRP
jgi:2-dehydropantoate 2-reductase